MKYLIDTDWLISLLRDRKPFVEQLQIFEPEGLALSIITVAELYEGVPFSRDPDATRTAIEAILDRFPILGLDREAAQLFGDLRARLRHQGNLIPDLDLLIAATAIRFDLILCSQNVGHFERIPELQLFSL